MPRGVTIAGGLRLAACAAMLASGPAFAGSGVSLAERVAHAEPGATITVSGGVHAGPIVIDRPMRLIGVNRPVIEGGGTGDAVVITAPDVELRGFAVRGTGTSLDREHAGIRALSPRVVIEDNRLDDVLFGIDLKESPDSVVRGNRIGGMKVDIARRGDGLRLWRADRCLVENNHFHDGRDAILWYSTGVIVRGNTARDCRYGLHLMFSHDVTIEENEVSGNSVGVYLMYSRGVRVARNRIVNNRGPSGYGIGLKDVDDFRLENNIVSGNRVGIYVDNSPFTRGTAGEYRRNMLAFNDTGMVLMPSARGGAIVENNFIDNLEQVSVPGRGAADANAFSRDQRGNFWSDYVGYDLDGDGVGEFEHASHRLFENLLEREPKLRMFLFSPAQQAVEFVGRALPAVAPEPRFADEWPLTRLAPVDAVPPRASPDRGAGAASAGLLAASAIIVAAGGPGGFTTGARRTRRKI